jgi:PmbA protein
VEISNAFFMEGGNYDTPVRSAMLSGNVFELHTAITGMSRESRAIGSLILPSIKIKSQRIIGK